MKKTLVFCIAMMLALGVLAGCGKKAAGKAIKCRVSPAEGTVRYVCENFCLLPYDR